MKIAIIADPLDNQRGGVHVYTKNVVNALQDRLDEIELILIRERIDTSLSEKINQIAIPNTKLPIGYASFRLFVLIPNVLRKIKPDIVIEPAHFGPFNLKKSVKRVTVIHDLTPIIFPQYHRWHSQFLQRIFLKRILCNADMVISNSENTSNDLRRIYKCTQEKIGTIPLGYDRHFKPTQSTDYLQDTKN